MAASSAVLLLLNSARTRSGLWRRSIPAATLVEPDGGDIAFAEATEVAASVHGCAERECWVFVDPNG